MDANTEAIIALAWARVLHLPDDALIASPSLRDGGPLTVVDSPVRNVASQPRSVPHRGMDGGLDGVEPSRGRLYSLRPQAEIVMFVRLLGHSVFLGPQWAIDRAEDYTDDELVAHRTLLSLTADRNGRGLGTGVLSFTDDYLALPGLEEATLTADPAAAHALESLCPPDDITEVGLSAMEHTFVLLAEDDTPTAGAGYDEWQGILAHMGVLTAYERRRAGRGRIAAALAVNDALDGGLIPQWRAHIDNDKSRSLAAALGFEELGTQTSALIG